MDALSVCICGTYGSRAEYKAHDEPVLVSTHEDPEVCPYCGAPLAYAEEEVVECASCGPMLRFQDRKDRRLFVKEELVAAFVAQTVGAAHVRNVGGYYVLGQVRGRMLFYVTAPEASFFSAHKGDVGVLYWRDGVEVPSDWRGQAFPMREFFRSDLASKQIVASQTYLDELLPPKPEKTKTAAKRVIHERRTPWLMFFSHHFSRPYRAKDFTRGKLRPAVVQEWFAENCPGAPTNTKTYQRDIRSFLEFDAEKQQADQREECIRTLLDAAADKNKSQAQRNIIARRAADLAEYLERKAKENGGRAIEVPKTAWQYVEDGERELVTVSDNADQFYDAVEDRLAAR